MPLATLIKPFLLPPFGLVVLAIVGAAVSRWRRRLGRGLLAAALLALYLMAVGPFAVWLIGLLQTEPALTTAAAKASGAQAIVVLSADQTGFAADYGGETAGNLTIERLRRGARLQRETGLPVLVSGGLLPRHRRSLADAMREALEVDFAVPVRWLEDRSRTTAENAAYSAAILKPAGIKRVLLVTSAWHMPRALLAFRAAGLDPVAAPTGFVSAGQPFAWEDLVAMPHALQLSTWAVHEMLGYVWYRLVGPPRVPAA
jgi:uncharacterized SAM-binding protein YcdF (DUF218 family)